jgi:transposase InsO family protein
VFRELSVVEQRYQAVLAVIEDGLSITEVAAKVGVSRQTMHTWLSRYAEGGLAGLGDRSHRPKSSPLRMDARVEVRLHELRVLHPGWGADRLLYRLGKEGFDALPSRAAVSRALVRLGLVHGDKRRSKREYRRWERGRPMELWQMDVVGGIVLVDGSEVKAVTAVDDHSRYCIAVGLVSRATSRPVCEVLAAALRQHGVPEEILTDNGKVFTGRHGLRPTEVLFDRICRENGIKHRLTAPYSPTTTGKVERFHGTLRRECLNGRVFDDITQAQAVVDAWITEYNEDRPHQSLARRVPGEVFRSAAPPPGPELELGALGTKRTGDDWINRRVAVNGVISVAWQIISVGKHYGGQTVDVHVGDRLIEIWLGDDVIKSVARTTKGEIRKKRAQRPTITNRRQGSPEKDPSTVN